MDSSATHDAVDKETKVAADLAVPQPSDLEEAAPVIQKADAPPNGGRLAWLQVAGCAALYLNTLGVCNTYGAFQGYYELDLLSGNSSSAIAWIGSVQVFFLMAFGVFIGPMFDAGFFHSLLGVGTFLVTFGFMMTSISTTYWQVFLAQGVCIGLGTSFLMVPCIALVPMYFTTKRAWAMSLATLGSGCGATVYPLLFEALQPRVGFPWTVRILGFISMVMGIFAITITRPRYKMKKGESRSLRELIRQAELTDPKYIVYVIAIFFNNVGFFEPLFYIQSYALSHGMEGQPLAGYLLVILNASSIPGRLVPSYISRRLGVVNTIILIYFMAGACVFYWISASNTAGNVAMAVLYGFFSGGVVAFQAVVMTSITDDLSILGTRLGALSILKGLGSLAGPPIAGALINGSGGYLGMQLFTGFAIMLSVAFSIALRLMLKGKKGIR